MLCNTENVEWTEHLLKKMVVIQLAKFGEGYKFLKKSISCFSKTWEIF